MIIIKKKNRKYLYLKFFDVLKQKTVEKSTGLIDSLENRETIKNVIIPAIEKAMNNPTFLRKTLKNYIEFYLRSKENLATYSEIESKSNLILKHFGDIEIEKISPMDCENFILNLEKSSKTKRNYKNVLSGIFDIGIKDRVIVENPTKFIKIFKSEEELENEEISPFSKIEVNLILENATDILKNFLALGFYTGARSGEILGLQIQDIDFENKTILISKQYTRNKLKNKLKANKSRVIPLFEPLMPYLIDLKQRAIKNKSFNLFSKIGEPNKILSIDNIRGKKRQFEK